MPLDALSPSGLNYVIPLLKGHLWKESKNMCYSVEVVSVDIATHGWYFHGVLSLVQSLKPALCLIFSISSPPITSSCSYWPESSYRPLPHVLETAVCACLCLGRGKWAWKVRALGNSAGLWSSLQGKFAGFVIRTEQNREFLMGPGRLWALSAEAQFAVPGQEPKF